MIPLIIAALLTPNPEPQDGTAKVGNATITVNVENTDFLSQCQAEWDKIQEKKNPKKKDEDKDKKHHNPEASITIKWGQKDDKPKTADDNDYIDY